MNLREMAERYLQLKEEIDELAAQKSALQKEFDDLRFGQIPDKMDEEGYESLRVAGVGTIILTDDINVRLVPDDKMVAYEWFRQENFGDIVVDYIHPSTLKAFVKEQLGDGVALPEDIFKYTPYVRASVRRS